MSRALADGGEGPALFTRLPFKFLLQLRREIRICIWTLVGDDGVDIGQVADGHKRGILEFGAVYQ